MDKGKSPATLGGTARFGGVPSPPSTFPVQPEPSDSGVQFSHDISRMSDYPPRSTGHRRAYSEILCLPDDISFDSDLGVVGSGEVPSFSDDTEEDLLSMYLDMDMFMSSSSATSGMDLSGIEAVAGAQSQLTAQGEGSSERPRIRHHHSQSMDGFSSIKSEVKKAMSAANLADLALIDPKRAKRIWANRQSAARSKERKMRYIAELERKVQTLQTEATTSSAQLAMLQRDTNGLTAENNKLKLRLQSMEQHFLLQDALNGTLREEVHRLKVATGEATYPNGGPLMNYGSHSFAGNQNFYNHNHAMQPLKAAHLLQQLQNYAKHQQQLHPHQQQKQLSDHRLKAPMTSQTVRESTTDSASTPKE